jgi:hypothetical protein
MQDRPQTHEAKLDEVKTVLRRLQHIDGADEADPHAPTQSDELQWSSSYRHWQVRVAVGVGLVLFAGLAGVVETALGDIIVHFASKPAFQTSLVENTEKYTYWVSPTTFKESLHKQAVDISRRYAGWVSPSELEDRLAWQRSNDLAPYKDWISPALLREKLEEQSSNLAKKYQGWVSPSELTEKLRSGQLSVELKYKDWVAPEVAMDRLLQQRKEISDRYEGWLSSTEMAEKVAEKDATVRSEFKGWVSPEEMAKAVDVATSSLRQELQQTKAAFEQTSQALETAQKELQETNAKQHFDEAGDDPCKKLQYAMWQSSCYLGPIDGRMMSLETIRSVDQYFGSNGAEAPSRKYFSKNFDNLNGLVARGQVHALCQSDLQLKGYVCSPAVDLRDLRDSMLRDPDDNSTDPEGLINWNAGSWFIRGRFPADGSGKTSIRLKWRRGAKVASLKILSVTGSVQCVDIREADGRDLDGERRQSQCDDPGEWFRGTIAKLNANELTLVVERKQNSKDPNYILFLRWPI